MNNKLHSSLVVPAMLALSSLHFEPSIACAQGTAFTYQGRLNNSGSLANGSYDFQFMLLNTEQSGSPVAPVLTNSAVSVINGLFSATVDFGPGIFTGSNLWLDISVRTNGSGMFTELLPRQALLPTPYAIMANSASNVLGPVLASQLSGTIGNSQLASSSITVSAGTGLGGGGAVALGGSTMLSNAGVLSVVGNSDITATTVDGAVTLGDTATSVNTAGTIVKRDVSGNFSAGIVTATSLNGAFSGNGSALTNIPLTGLQAVPLTNNQSGVTLNGTFSGNGLGLTSLNPENFGAGTAAINISGNAASATSATAASTATTANNFSGSLAGDVTGTQGATVVSKVGGVTAVDVANGANAANAATSGNSANTIVERDPSGSFSAGTITANLTGSATLASNVVSGIGITNAFITNSVFAGNGGGLTNLNVNASQLSGTIGNSQLASSSITVNAGTGLAGGGTVALGGSTTFSNAGVLSVVGNSDITATTMGGAVTLGDTATSVNTASTIVKRDASGNFSAGSITLSGLLILPGATGQYATVGGGLENTASRFYSTVGGGQQNTASGGASTVGGGDRNIASSTYATVGGGAVNTSSANASTVGGGAYNLATNLLATVPGGNANIAGGQYSFAAGNQAQALHQGAFVWADSQDANFSSTANDQFLIRAQGGVGIGTTSPQQTLSLNGGMNIDQAGQNSGGTFNSPTGPGLSFGNLSGEGIASQRNGGGVNQDDLAFYTDYLPRLTILNNGSVGIGQTNPRATLDVEGGPTGTWANPVVLFENTNTSTGNSPALRVVNAGGTNGDGALSVSANVSVNSASGLIAEFGNASQFVVTITNDGTIYCKATVLTSDRNAKENFTALDPETILAKVVAMPVTEWNYKEDSASKRHIGPVAQDFRAAFGLNGEDDTHISVIDENGVALAAIQGLNEKLENEVKEKDAEIQTLRQQIDSFAERLIQLEASMKQLATRE